MSSRTRGTMARRELLEGQSPLEEKGRWNRCWGRQPKPRAFGAEDAPPLRSLAGRENPFTQRPLQRVPIIGTRCPFGRILENHRQARKKRLTGRQKGRNYRMCRQAHGRVQIQVKSGLLSGRWTSTHRANSGTKKRATSETHPIVVVGGVSVTMSHLLCSTRRYAFPFLYGPTV